MVGRGSLEAIGLGYWLILCNSGVTNRGVFTAWLMPEISPLLLHFWILLKCKCNWKGQ